MARRRKVALDEAGVEEFFVASPEDVVLAKLLWRRPSGSMKQWTDVLGFLRCKGNTLSLTIYGSGRNTLGLSMI
jgi:hypothetical protein